MVIARGSHPLRWLPVIPPPGIHTCIDHTIVSGSVYVTEKSKSQSSCAFPFLSHYYHIKTLLKPDVYGVFPHHAILWDTSWWFYNVTQFKHHLPGDGISSHKLRSQSHSTAPYHFRSWSQIQVVICASKWLAIKIGSHDSLFRFKLFVRVTHRTQETYLLTRLLVSYKRNSQMEGMWKKGAEFPCSL